jgi:hypothetical protein
MKRIEITITEVVPDSVTNEEIVEWARYVTGNRGAISMENPLVNKELSADSVLVMERRRT